MCLEASQAAADGVIMPALLHAVEDLSLKKILPGMRPKWFQIRATSTSTNPRS